jgi:flagellar basal-body rod protein FlgG
MINGIFTASESMSILQNKIDNTSHNMANSNTSGFKRSIMVTQALVEHQRNDENLLHQDESQDTVGNYVQWDQGSLVQTENPFDMALEGEGFFEVETPDGVMLTRNGAFTLNSMGELVTLEGNHVLDSGGGRITLESNQLNISEAGHISVNSKDVNQLGIVKINNKEALLRKGNNLFEVMPGQDPQMERQYQAKVKQGFIESSNVNIVDSMVEMIRFQRQFESNQKSVHSIDSTLEKAVNEIGTVR